MSKKRRVYSREFKLEAVKLVTEKGYSVSEDLERNAQATFIMTVCPRMGFVTKTP